MTICPQERINCLITLEKVNESTDIYDFIPKKCRPSAIETSPSVNAFYESLYSFASPAITVVPMDDLSSQEKKAKRAFLKVILKWRDELSNYYWENHLTHSKLEFFQTSIRKITSEGRLDIIRQKLLNLGFNSKTLQNSINQLEREMGFFLNTPQHSLLSSELKKASVEEDEQTLSDGENIPSIDKIESQINNILEEETEYKKLGALICGLNLRTLNMLIYKLDKHQLVKINEIISDSHYTNLDEMKAYFEERVNDWIDQCNNVKKEIDELNKDLRRKPTSCGISRQDINTISAYTEKVDLFIVNSTKIGWLIEDVITDLELKHAPTEGALKDYMVYRTRLTEKHEYAGRPAGCVWGIIHRLSFGRFFPKNPDYDDECATKMFDDWAIKHPNDYRKVGLLGDISDQDFEKIKQDISKIEKIAKSVLGRLGIEKIKHWKRKDILNFVFFKDYLSEAEVREKVNATVKHLLSCE